MYVSTKTNINRSVFSSINSNDNIVEPSKCVKNLGVMFDEHLSMACQVNTICKSVNFHLHNLWRIRKYLDRKSTERVVHAIISSRLDYGNALLYGIPMYMLNKLQRLQNNAARLVTLSPKMCHVNPLLVDLHWLPVIERINYKVLLTVFKALNGLGPSYISELLVPYKPARSLRSSGKGLLFIPKARLKCFGDKCFSTYAPKLWNSLPLALRNAASVSIFKDKLKTFLFTRHYS